MLEKVGRPGGGWLVHTSLHKKQLYQFVRFHHFREELFKFGALEMERAVRKLFELTGDKPALIIHHLKLPTLDRALLFFSDDFYP